MIRQTLNLGHMQYVIDMFDAYTDNIVHYDEFVMVRNYDIVNGVYDDKDLYFIERSIWDGYLSFGLLLKKEVAVFQQITRCSMIS